MENSKETPKYTYLNLSNYYGAVALMYYNDKYYMTLQDHSSDSRLEIDKETYLILIKLDGKKSEKY